MVEVEKNTYSKFIKFIKHDNVENFVKLYKEQKILTGNFKELLVTNSLLFMSEKILTYLYLRDPYNIGELIRIFTFRRWTCRLGMIIEGCKIRLAKLLFIQNISNDFNDDISNSIASLCSITSMQNKFAEVINLLKESGIDNLLILNALYKVNNNELWEDSNEILLGDTIEYYENKIIIVEPFNKESTDTEYINKYFVALGNMVKYCFLPETIENIKQYLDQKVLVEYFKEYKTILEINFENYKILDDDVEKILYKQCLINLINSI